MPITELTWKALEAYAKVFPKFDTPVLTYNWNTRQFQYVTDTLLLGI